MERFLTVFIILDKLGKINSPWGIVSFPAKIPLSLTPIFPRATVKKKGVKELDTFPKRIYRLVSQIPTGKVSTYGQLAMLAGSPRAARIVGAAMRRAPAGLPCHRVLYGDGSLCCDQAFGGKEIQRGLLEQEGVPFLPDGRVDMEVCLWNPTKSEIYI